MSPAHLHHGAAHNVAIPVLLLVLQRVRDGEDQSAQDLVVSAIQCMEGPEKVHQKLRAQHQAANTGMGISASKTGSGQLSC